MMASRRASTSGSATLITTSLTANPSPSSASSSRPPPPPPPQLPPSRQSPYREMVYLKQVNRRARQQGPLVAGICLATSLLLYADIYHVSVINRLVVLPEFVDYVKSGLCVTLFALAMGHVVSFVYAHLGPERDIEQSHAKLLSISKDDFGFRIRPDTPPSTRHSHGSHRSPSVDMLAAGSFCLPSAHHSLNESSTSFNTSMTSTSWQFQTATAGVTGTSAGMTNQQRAAAASAASYKSSPSYEKLLAKTRYPNARALDWHIEDEQSADAYLLERSREHSFLGSIHDDIDGDGIAGVGSGSLLATTTTPKKTSMSVIDTGVEAIQRLFKAQPYKVASPSQAEKEKSCSESGSAVICRRWHIDEKQLFKWNERLRFWFHREIFVPLCRQIDEINANIAKFGLGKDNMIGTASTAQLRHLATLKGSCLPGLENVIPFLEITSNQQYITGRLKEFCSGGALSEMNWKRGGASWNDQLPPDAQILMHAFCTYVNACLTPDPEFPDRRQFTTLHFKSSLREANIDTKGPPQVLIHHTKACPPHYLLQLGSDVVDVGSGSNNALHTIILFLYYQKIKNDARICNMPMGPAGMNLLRIIS